MLGFVTDKSIIPHTVGTKHKDRLEMIQLDPNADLPVEMIIANLREQIQTYETSKQ